jgi:O-antigen/teichoic acid export membrane protein
MSIDRIAVPGSLLTLDLLIVSLVNWIYWLVISKIVTPADVGQATSVNSFAFLASTVTLMGLEYTLVKKASLQRSRILGTTLVIQLMFMAISIPILFYLINQLYQGSFYELSWLGVGIVIFSSLRYIFRFALLGIYSAKSVLIIDSLGVLLQLAVGLSLVSIGFGAFGILIAFLLNFVFMTCLSFVIARRSFELYLGSLIYAKEILRDALVNTPAAFAKTFIYSLSIILLAYLGINQSEVGIFYIALMVSFVVGSFAGYMAFMAIPASLSINKDLSVESNRIGLTVTGPLIVTLMVEPKLILSIIGSEYVSAALTLVVLAVAIFPYILVTNAISSFNSAGRSKQITAIGLIQILAFLLAFFYFVPRHGTFGAAISILIAYVASSLPSVIWSRVTINYVFRYLLPILSGLVVGYLIRMFFNSNNSLAIILISITITLAVGFGLKNTSSHEIIAMAKRMVGIK